LPAVVVHGGAGGAGRRSGRQEAVAAAVDAAWRLLADGGTALDAVIAACRVLEDAAEMNAGYGSCLTRDGHVEVDALVMDGTDLAFGAVGAVRGVRYASELARQVLLNTPHAFLVADGARALAEQWTLTVPEASLIAPHVVGELTGADQEGAGIVAEPAAVGDTVGAVAVDVAGRAAAATSTGGIAGKWSGRVGDSPIPGAGGYADNRTGAVSSTGQGEHILRVSLAFRAQLALAEGASAAAAARSAMAILQRDTPGLAGLIVVDAAGDIGWDFNTRAMPVAWRSATGGGAVFFPDDGG
jgi:beta-aspartyl-peptidase (threonine type)